MREGKRKVGFFYLTYRKNEDNIAIENGVLQILNNILSLPKNQRKQDLTNDKFCFIESFEYDNEQNILKLLFKSAKHSYRSPLINKRTVEERDNPKSNDEGERYLTHLIVRFVDGDAIVFLETYQGALKLSQITDYLNKFILLYNSSHKRSKINFSFSFDIIPRDNFREVLDSLKRVVCANVYIEKQLLGSDSLNFSNRINEVQEEIVIEVKAKRNRDISSTVNDLFTLFSGGQSIKKMRIVGKSQTNNEIILDTDFMSKKEYVNAQFNEDTGEVNSNYLFSQLSALALDL